MPNYLWDRPKQKKEVVSGVVKSINEGTNKVRVTIDGTKQIIARCDKKVLSGLKVDDIVIVGFTGKNDTGAYILSAGQKKSDSNVNIYTI